MTSWIEPGGDHARALPNQVRFNSAYWGIARFPSAAQLAQVIRPRRRAAASYFHGWRHWRGVAAIGYQLALLTPGSDIALVMLFALLHDVERHDDYDDPEHGERSAFLVEQKGGSLGLTARGASLLSAACRGHNQGATSNDPTIAVCWDADRLTLSRVGIVPRLEFLSTDAARKPAMHALGKAMVDHPPSWRNSLHLLRDGQPFNGLQFLS